MAAHGIPKGMLIIDANVYSSHTDGWLQYSMPNGITNHKPLTTNPDLHFPLCRGTEGALYTLTSKLKKDEKRNLEIHSSDLGGNSYRHSDYPRSDLLYGVLRY